MTRLPMFLALVGLTACPGSTIPDDPDAGTDAVVEDCDVAGDEDSDGAEGCADSDCWGSACDEDCDNPGDEDGDRLQDCEDPDCFGADGCVEVACDDGVDNDDDGLTDCQDDDCWGNGCAARSVQFTGIGATPQRVLYRYSYIESCRGNQVEETVSSAVGIALQSITGVLRNHTANGVTSTCGITGYLGLSKYVDDANTLTSAGGTFETEEGCGLTWGFSTIVNDGSFTLSDRGAVQARRGGPTVFAPRSPADFRDAAFTYTSGSTSGGCTTATRSVYASYAFPMVVRPNVLLGQPLE